MKTTRRGFVRTACAGALGTALVPVLTRLARSDSTARRYDVAVIGAGTFGAWTAWHLRKRKRSVLLVDAYGPGNSRASSGGETRVIRMGYGAQELYTRWSLRSLTLWKELAQRAHQPLFHATGVLWMARTQDPLTASSLEMLQRLGVPHERLDRAKMERRWPQIAFGENRWAIHEPQSGVLMARRAVQAVVAEAVDAGVTYIQKAVTVTEQIPADTLVYACGPWLPKLFPDLLGERIFPTRQEVFYFGPAAGDERFKPPAMPVWVDFADEIYGIPDIENKGFKIAPDRHGPYFDPDMGERTITRATLAGVREFVARRFPALKDAPLVASEVCQYENTSNGDFLIDRHPQRESVWLIGGGSGHGFKHGPALGEYVAARIIEGGPVDPRFCFATKEKVEKRTVY